MRESYSSVKENGLDYAMSIAGDLRSQGYEVISGPKEAMVPRGEGSDGKPILVPGYSIIVDDGRPSYAPIITE